MRRSALRLALATLMFAGCETAPEAAVAPSLNKVPKDTIPDKQHITQPYRNTVNNPCPPVPEMVVVEGTARFHSHFKFYEEGNTLRSQAIVTAKGIGLTTGVKYTFHELFRQTASYRYDDRIFKSDQLTRWHVISATGLGNFFATSHQKVSCPPDGPCTIEPIEFETDCRG